MYRTPFAYFDLIETFPKGGCAVCKLVQRDTAQYVDTVLFEYANEPALRARFADGRGVCYDHGLLLKHNKIGNVIGVARLYRESLDALLEVLDAAGTAEKREPRGLFARKRPDANAVALAERLEPQNGAGCMVCDKLIEFEQLYIDMFNRYLGEARFVEALRTSDGVCLPHLRVILRHVEQPDHAQTLVSIQRDVWRSLRDEVALFEDKQNYERLGGGFGAEADSWVRAILRLAGEVFGLRRR
jgi:hypothetical protein